MADLRRLSDIDLMAIREAYPPASADSSESSRDAEHFDCETCHDAHWVRRGDFAVGHQDFGKAMPCPDCRSHDSVPVAVGVPDEFRGVRFEAFDLRRNPKMRPALDQAQRVARGDAWCALLSGNPGIGKTLLACCALNESTHPRPGRFRVFGDLLYEIRDMMFGQGMLEDDAIRPWREGPMLLVLDDVGAEKLTEWAEQTLYAVLNARYTRKLPTIVTTNNPDAIPYRVMDRYAVGYVACEGVSQRPRPQTGGYR